MTDSIEGPQSDPNEDIYRRVAEAFRSEAMLSALELIGQLRKLFTTLTPEQRELVGGALYDGYCLDCYEPDPDNLCKCWSDD